MRALISFVRAPPTKPNHLLKVLPPNVLTSGIRFQHRNESKAFSFLVSLWVTPGPHLSLCSPGSSPGKSSPAIKASSGARPQQSLGQLAGEVSFICPAMLSHTPLGFSGGLPPVRCSCYGCQSHLCPCHNCGHTMGRPIRESDAHGHRDWFRGGHVTQTGPVRLSPEMDVGTVAEEKCSFHRHCPPGCWEFAAAGGHLACLGRAPGHRQSPSDFIAQLPCPAAPEADAPGPPIG